MLLIAGIKPGTRTPFILNKIGGFDDQFITLEPADRMPQPGRLPGRVVTIQVDSTSILPQLALHDKSALVRAGYLDRVRQ